MRNEKLGDKMPDRRNVKWGSMVAGNSHLSDEYNVMNAGDSDFSDKWDGQTPSPARMSEQWVNMEAGNAPDNEWHDMKQEGREDAYSMAPSSGTRSEGFKKQVKVKPENKVSRATQHTEFGSTREL